jgi:hypothetical protein
VAGYFLPHVVALGAVPSTSLVAQSLKRGPLIEWRCRVAQGTPKEAGWRTRLSCETDLPACVRFTRLVARVKYGAFLRGRMSKALGGLVLLEPAMKLMPALHYR